MQVLSRCPLRAASILWLPRPGAFTLTVVCKATFRLAPDVSPLAVEQDAPVEGDSHWDDDPGRSLALASDLVPFKVKPEVLAVGHAYAPRGRPATSLLARLAVGDVDKAVEVTGERALLLDGSISSPSRFTKMPLRWERAAGGPGTSNPVGVPMGSEAYPDAWGRIPLPSLLPAGSSIADPGDVVAPACFAPIAPHWPSRAARLHRHAATWDPAAWHLRPLPPDIDGAFFNAAPADQVLRELSGDERITLEHLHPDHPVLVTRLARIAPRAAVDWGTGAPHDLPLACDTLLVDTDRGVATLTFRAHVALDFPDRAGWVVITMAGPGPRRTLVLGTTVSGEPVDAAPRPALPFVGPAPGEAAGAPLPLPFATAISDEATDATADPGEGLGGTQRMRPVDDLDDAETFAPGLPDPLEPSAPAVPAVVPRGPRLGAFRLGGPAPAPVISEAAPPAAPPAAAPPSATSLPAPFAAADIEDALTMDPDEAAAVILPFLPNAHAGIQGPVPPGTPAAAPQGPTAQPPAPAPGGSLSPAAGKTIGELVAELRSGPRADATPPSSLPRPTPPSGTLPPLDIPMTGDAPEPPPLLGAVAAPEPPPADPSAEPPPATEPAPEGAPEAEAEALVEEGPAPPPLPVEEFPLERCARLAASIARTPSAEARILDEADLPSISWEDLKRHWLSVIAADQERGRRDRAEAYDAAYVAQLEAERGAITIDEYAMLTVSVERGTQKRKLVELGLPPGAYLRIQRAWMNRMIDDPAFAAAVREAIEAARSS